MNAEFNGGEAGIRTLGNLTATRALQARALGQAMRPLQKLRSNFSSRAPLVSVWARGTISLSEGNT